jgi:hypothetical protein
VGRIRRPVRHPRRHLLLFRPRLPDRVVASPDGGVPEPEHRRRRMEFQPVGHLVLAARPAAARRLCLVPAEPVRLPAAGIDRTGTEGTRGLGQRPAPHLPRARGGQPLPRPVQPGHVPRQPRHEPHADIARTSTAWRSHCC